MADGEIKPIIYRAGCCLKLLHCTSFESTQGQADANQDLFESDNGVFAARGKGDCSSRDVGRGAMKYVVT